MLIKLVILCFLCLLIDNTHSLDQDQKVAEFYYNKCYRQTGKLEAFEKLSRDSNDFLDYLRYTFTKIPDNGADFCKSDRKILNNKISEVAKDLTPCLPPQEKFLSDFIDTSFREFTHFWCHNDRDHMKKLFSAQNKACRDNLGDDITTRLSSCFGRIFKPKANYLTKKEVCEDISVAEKCFGQVLDEKCPHTSSYRNLNEIFFRYISKPCSGCISQMNGLLLILCVTVAYLFSKN